MKHAIYTLRWIVLAVPGAWFLAAVQNIVPSQFWAMIISQGVLGYFVYWIDRRILGGKQG